MFFLENALTRIASPRISPFLLRFPARLLILRQNILYYFLQRFRKHPSDKPPETAPQHFPPSALFHYSVMQSLFLKILFELFPVKAVSHDPIFVKHAVVDQRLARIGFRDGKHLRVKTVQQLFPLFGSRENYGNTVLIVALCLLAQSPVISDGQVGKMILSLKSAIEAGTSHIILKRIAVIGRIKQLLKHSAVFKLGMQPGRRPAFLFVPHGKAGDFSLVLFFQLFNKCQMYLRKGRPMAYQIDSIQSGVADLPAAQAEFQCRNIASQSKKEHVPSLCKKFTCQHMNKYSPALILHIFVGADVFRALYHSTTGNDDANLCIL